MGLVDLIEEKNQRPMVGDDTLFNHYVQFCVKSAIATYAVADSELSVIRVVVPLVIPESILGRDDVYKDVFIRDVGISNNNFEHFMNHDFEADFANNTYNQIEAVNIKLNDYLGITSEVSYGKNDYDHYIAVTLKSSDLPSMEEI